MAKSTKKHREEKVKPGGSLWTEAGHCREQSSHRNGWGCRVSLGLDAHCLLPVQTGLRRRSEAEFILGWWEKAQIGYSTPYSVPWKILEGVQFRYNNCSHEVYKLLGKDRLNTTK